MQGRGVGDNGGLIVEDEDFGERKIQPPPPLKVRKGGVE